MSEPIRPDPWAPTERTLPSSVASVLAGSGLLAAAFAGAMVLPVTSLLLLLAALVGVSATLGLATLRYDLAVALAFLLLGVVFVEPAPVDGLLGVLIAVAIATRRVDLRAVPRSVRVLLGLLLLLNVLSMIETIDWGEALRFFVITAYLVALAVWLTGYVESRERARNVVGAYVVGAVAIALVTSLALYLPVPGRSVLTVEQLRGRGLLEDANVYGPFLIPPALILLEELLFPRLLAWGRTLKLGMLLVLSAGVLLSYSRAAWVAYGASLLVLFAVLAVRRGSLKRLPALLGIMVILGAVAAGMLAATGSFEFLRERAAIQSYDTERFAAQRAAARLGFEHPVGIGPGQFDVVSDVSTHSLYRACARRAGCPRPPGDLGDRSDHPGARSAASGTCPRNARDRVGGVTSDVGRADAQLVLHRHRPLAPSLGRRRHDLGWFGTGAAASNGVHHHLMRVLLVSQPIDGGVFKHVSDLANALTGRGHEVVVATPLRSRPASLRAEVVPIPMTRGVAVADDTRAISTYVAAIRRVRPDVVHAHSSKAGVVARLARVALPSVPVIYTPHGYAFVGPFSARSRDVFRLVERALSPLATRVICVCDAEQRLAASVGARSRTRVVHNGINVGELPSPMPPAGLPDQTPGSRRSAFFGPGRASRRCLTPRPPCGSVGAHCGS